MLYMLEFDRRHFDSRGQTVGRQVAGSLQERVLAGTVTLILATPTSLVF